MGEGVPLSNCSRKKRVLELGCSGHHVTELQSMRRSVVASNDPELEWSLRKDSQVIYNLKHVIQSRVLPPGSKSRDTALSVQLRMVSSPILEAHPQGKSLDFLKGVNVPSKVGVPNDGAVFEMRANK